MDHAFIAPKAYPIAIELLAAERDRLLRDHYDAPPRSYDPDDRGYVSCDGCARAFAIREELEKLVGHHLEV